MKTTQTPTESPTLTACSEWSISNSLHCWATRSKSQKRLQSQRNAPTCALEELIVNKILTLPPETILLSDHSSPITAEQERRLFLG
ncbi:MAG: hypothetical protein HDR94_08525 [Bacteroides sp.]|nr:hypothetical protein [Bacteroides sp.]